MTTERLGRYSNLDISRLLWLRKHIASKGERHPISMQLYNQTFPIIVETLEQSILSTDNPGFTKLVIYGSWARRNYFTGPSFESDLDILGISYYVSQADLLGYQYNLTQAIQEKTKHFVHIPMVEMSWRPATALMGIYTRSHKLTQDGCVIISA